VAKHEKKGHIYGQNSRRTKHDMPHTGVLSPGLASEKFATQFLEHLSYVQDHPIDIAASLASHLLLPVHLCKLNGALTKLIIPFLTSRACINLAHGLNWTFNLLVYGDRWYGPSWHVSAYGKCTGKVQCACLCGCCRCEGYMKRGAMVVV
jgi:hypothetical protein